MTPATYVEKVPTFTAVQWDGTEESAGWVLEHAPGSEYDDGVLTVRDALDRRQVVPQGTWIVREDATGGVTRGDDAAFRARFKAA